MAPRKAFDRYQGPLVTGEYARNTAGVQGKKTKSYTGVRSGSEITQEQDLLMRVLYTKEKGMASFGWDL
jgi:hypothetical protein